MGVEGESLFLFSSSTSGVIFSACEFLPCCLVPEKRVSGYRPGLW